MVHCLFKKLKAIKEYCTWKTILSKDWCLTYEKSNLIVVSMFLEFPQKRIRNLLKFPTLIQSSQGNILYCRWTFMLKFMSIVNVSEQSYTINKSGCLFYQFSPFKFLSRASCLTLICLRVLSFSHSPN